MPDGLLLPITTSASRLPETIAPRRAPGGARLRGTDGFEPEPVQRENETCTRQTEHRGGPRGPAASARSEEERSMTEEVFRADAYARSCEARITAVSEAGIELDRTVFYPLGGGQPGDTGCLRLGDGGEVAIVDTRKSPEPGAIVHVPAQPAGPELAGQTVLAEIDWERRYRLMRMHTLLHVLCGVAPGGVTGGSVRDGSGRIDFDLPETRLERERVESELNRLVREDHAVRARWITDEELAANPGLVRTMSVRPPSGQGMVRVMEIEGVDLQPCGGTHVASTAEIGPVVVTKIEKKGRHNRRVTVAFAP